MNRNMNSQPKSKNPFGSLTRRNKRMNKAAKKGTPIVNPNLKEIFAKTTYNSNEEELDQYNKNWHETMARKVGYNSSVANAGLARSKYIESCEKQGIKPDPKVVAQYQQDITNAINRLRNRKFGKTRKPRKL